MRLLAAQSTIPMVAIVGLSREETQAVEVVVKVEAAVEAPLPAQKVQAAHIALRYLPP